MRAEGDFDPTAGWLDIHHFKVLDVAIVFAFADPKAGFQFADFHHHNNIFFLVGFLPSGLCRICRLSVTANSVNVRYSTDSRRPESGLNGVKQDSIYKKWKRVVQAKLPDVNIKEDRKYNEVPLGRGLR